MVVAAVIAMDAVSPVQAVAEQVAADSVEPLASSVEINGGFICVMYM